MHLRNDQEERPSSTKNLARLLNHLETKWNDSLSFTKCWTNSEWTVSKSISQALKSIRWSKRLLRVFD